MSGMKEMAQDYKLAAAKIAIYIKLHAAELSEYDLKIYRQSLREIRTTAKTLEDYYDFPRRDPNLW